MKELIPFDLIKQLIEKGIYKLYENNKEKLVILYLYLETITKGNVKCQK